MSPLKVRTLKEANRYARNLKPRQRTDFGQPEVSGCCSPSLEKRLGKIEKKQTEFNTRLNFIWKIILLNNLKIK